MYYFHVSSIFFSSTVITQKCFFINFSLWKNWKLSSKIKTWCSSSVILTRTAFSYSSRTCDLAKFGDAIISRDIGLHIVTASPAPCLSRCPDKERENRFWERGWEGVFAKFQTLALSLNFKDNLHFHFHFQCLFASGKVCEIQILYKKLIFLIF